MTKRRKFDIENAGMLERAASDKWYMEEFLEMKGKLKTVVAHKDPSSCPLCKNVFADRELTNLSMGMPIHVKCLKKLGY